MGHLSSKERSEFFQYLDVEKSPKYPMDPDHGWRRVQETKVYPWKASMLKKHHFNVGAVKMKNLRTSEELQISIDVAALNIAKRLHNQLKKLGFVEEDYFNDDFYMPLIMPDGSCCPVPTFHNNSIYGKLGLPDFGWTTLITMEDGQALVVHAESKQIWEVDAPALALNLHEQLKKFERGTTSLPNLIPDGWKITKKSWSNLSASGSPTGSSAIDNLMIAICEDGEKYLFSPVALILSCALWVSAVFFTRPPVPRKGIPGIRHPWSA
eukprot:Platyproteum_vivax@DN5583_c0_g1_i1.p1